MNEYIGTGALGRFQGFIACIISAAFVIAGPEYISMVRVAQRKLL
jgi:amino acid transporter